MKDTLIEAHEILMILFSMGCYKVINIKGNNDVCELKTHYEVKTEALHYLLYRYMLDRNDNRFSGLFNYVLEPDYSIPLEIDMNVFSIDDMVDFMAKIKNK